MKKDFQFFKYQSTGNDFILIDGSVILESMLSVGFVQWLCDRHFGVGADGCIVLLPSADASFFMRYYNSDGREASVCGNGMRAAVLFAYHQKKIPVGQSIEFYAADGKHQAELLLADENEGNVQVSLRVKGYPLPVFRGGYFINTGSPHVVMFVDNADRVDVLQEGRAIRYDHQLFPEGTNVNFVSIDADGTLYVRTYERGVEDETLSCGTGVTASAITWAVINHFSGNVFSHVRTRGGRLSLSFLLSSSGVEQVYLTGPSQKVFEGKLYIKL